MRTGMNHCTLNPSFKLLPKLLPSTRFFGNSIRTLKTPNPQGFAGIDD